ncbi:2'-5' RNA ligase family protein [Actinoplanes sp. NPDC020271]|uniref:2'-5' RNA ligase family protein n=1 Tax=Actinoplanes sp. NPDC020271 TaxID=3363896 RepID=UPI0037B36327
MHTVELLLDQELEDAVRRQWSWLRNAGLPSLADHPHPTNRPHLTVIRAPSLTGLPSLTLPLVAELGPVRRLGRALVREVVPTPELRELHHRIRSALPDAWPPPQEWTPHVSLALRFPGTTTPAIPAGRDRGQFAAARTYDTVTRMVRELA